MDYSQITGWGKALPARVFTNDDLSKIVDTSDEWIRKRTGIKQRYLAVNGETVLSMAEESSKRALERSNVDPMDLDLIIFVTSQPPSSIPPLASRLQYAIGARKSAAFDIHACCTGSIYAIAVADNFIKTGMYKRILITCSEMLSLSIDWSDRSTCVLFGDGAGSILLEQSKAPGIIGSVLHSDGEYAQLLSLPDTREFNGKLGAKSNESYIKMRGPELFSEAVNVGANVIKEIAGKYQKSLDDVDFIISHQANVRILKEIEELVGIREDKYYIDLPMYGNIASASIPIGICDAIEEEKMVPGSTVILSGFGGGLTWGATMIDWNPHK